MHRLIRSAVLVKDVNHQTETLGTSLGLLLKMAEVQMVVMNHDVKKRMPPSQEIHLGSGRENRCPIGR